MVGRIDWAKHSLLSCPVLDKFIKIFVLKLMKINLARPKTELGLIKEVFADVKESLRSKV